MTDEINDDITGAALLEEESQLRLSRFTYDDAWAIGTRLVEIGRTRSHPITIDVTRSGQQLFHAALPGSTPDNDAWVERKARTVLRFCHSSLYIGVECREANMSFTDRFKLDPALFTAAGGGFPVHVDGAGVIGTIAVSGLSQIEDHALVTATLRQLAAHT